MKKLALAIGLGAYIVFSASASSLAALRADTAAGIAANRDSRLAWSVTGTNARLLFLNEALYPDTSATVATGTSSRPSIAAAYPTITVPRMLCECTWKMQMYV